MFAVVWGLLAVSAPAQDLVAQAVQYRDLPAGIARRFTQLPRIEPALSARELMERRAVPQSCLNPGNCLAFTLERREEWGVRRATEDENVGMKADVAGQKARVA
jgi:hypothetical protein